MHTIRARLISPMTPTSVRYLPDARVTIDDGRFVDVSPYRGERCDRHLKTGVLLPGFVDAHIHAAQTRIVGSASGPLLKWLETSTFPEEANFVDRDHGLSVYSIFADKLLAAGTTSAFAYGSVHPGSGDALFEILAERGLRAIAGPVLMDTNCPDELVLGVEEAMMALDALGRKWHGYDHGRLQLAAIPRFALSCTAEMMTAAGALAKKNDWWISTHLSESVEECRIAQEMYGASDYLEVYEKTGLLTDKTIFAHCIHMSESEWSRFAAAGCKIAHCPDSNDFLGSGGMPLEPVNRHGISLAMGTDVAAGRSFKMPRTLSHAYDNGMRQGVQLSLANLLWWGTRGGAAALGLPVGCIQQGFEADFSWFELPSWCQTEEQILGSLLFDGDAPFAREVFVRGRSVYQHG